MAEEKQPNQKEYVIIYESHEHFEVLGFVNAGNLEEAKTRAQEELSAEAKKYNVVEAEIAELKDLNDIIFKV